MSTELAVRTDSRELSVLTNEQLQYIARTEFVPPGLRGNLPAILACVATGRALGIADMSALRSIHIIDGKATFSAELMVQLVRRNGHSITGEVTEGSATVRGKRADTGDEMQATWTLAMADRAGLLNKSNWKKYPEAMLWARAASQLCRMLFADCFAGSTYTPEELENVETVDHAPDEPAAMQPAETTGPAPITGPQKKKANVLVGQLRDAEHRLTTEDVYAAAGKHPGDYLDEAGELHWSPLRDSLTKAEARVLIDRLEEFDRSGAESVIGVAWAVQDAPPVAALWGGAEPGGLSLQEFKEQRLQLGVEAADVSAVAAELFPGRPIPELTDLERADVLAEAVSRSQVPA